MEIHQLRYFVAVGVVSLAVASSLDAHDFWIIPDAFTFADGGAISADGHSGTNFPGTPAAAAPASIADARLIGATGEIKIASIVQDIHKNMNIFGLRLIVGNASP